MSLAFVPCAESHHFHDYDGLRDGDDDGLHDDDVPHDDDDDVLHDDGPHDDDGDGGVHAHDGCPVYLQRRSSEWWYSCLNQILLKLSWI